MRILRLALYFLIGFLLSFVSALSFAATQYTIWNGQAGYTTDTFGWKNTFAEACSDECIAYNKFSGATWSCVSSTQTAPGVCKQTFSDGVAHSSWLPINKVVTCQDGQLPDSTGACPVDCKPDPTTGKKPEGCNCKAGDEVWVNFEGCRPSCHNTGGANAPLNAGFDYHYSPGQSRYCIQGCRAFPGEQFYRAKNGLRVGPMFALDGSVCDAAASPSPYPDKPVKETDIKDPVCKPTDGVMTSSSGRVMCVPEGTPSTNQPVVQTTSKTESFGDGSQRKTDTTSTTDPGTGATDTRQTVTATGAGGGSTAGQAGPVGSSSSTTSSSSTGSGSGDGGGGGDEGCDPTLNFCGGPATEGLYEKKDKTFSSVLSKFTSDINGTPFGQAMSQTLNISVPSAGACPNLATAIPFLNTSIDLAPYICNPTAIQYLEMMGTVLKIVVGYIALTWVFL